MMMNRKVNGSMARLLRLLWNAPVVRNLNRGGQTRCRRLGWMSYDMAGRKTKLQPDFENPDDLQVVSALHCAKVFAGVNSNKKLACRRLGITYLTLVRFLRVAREFEE